MAKDLATKKFMEDYGKLSPEEQEDLIKKLKDNKKKKAETPTTSGADARREKGGAEGWGA